MDKNYKKGLAWGKRIFKENVELFGNDVGVRKSYATTRTCEKYASGRVKKTKNGEVLTNESKNFYKGVADSMHEYYKKNYW